MALTDLTRISTSGIATGTSLSGAILHGDAHFRGTQVGVTSALFDSSDNALEFNDNVKLTFGNDGDLKIYHDPSNGSYIQDVGYGQLRFLSNDYVFYNAAGNENLVRITENTGVSLYDGTNTVRLATNDSGVVVTGILTASSFSGGSGGVSAGVVTCTGLDLNGNGDISGNLVLGGNLTVNGTTTTLDTNLIGVDRVEVGANSNTIVGVAITQSGSADLVRLYDGASQVVTVDDEGKVGLGTDVPRSLLHLHQSGCGFEVNANSGSNNARLLSYDRPASAYREMTLQALSYGFETNGAERLRITSGGLVGIGITNPGMPLHLSCAVQNAVKWQSSDSDGPLTHYYNGSTHVGNLGNSKGVMSSSNLHFGIGSKSDLLFGTKPSGGSSTVERLRITSEGKVCVTHTGALHSGNLQVSATGADAIDINAYSSNANSGGRLTFYRSKNASIGSNTIVVDDDSLGRIDFRGYNSNGNSYDQGATIEARVDGGVNSSTDMPTAIIFKTSNNGSASPDERLRIAPDGDVVIGNSSPVAGKLEINVGDVGNSATEYHGEDFAINIRANRGESPNEEGNGICFSQRYATSDGGIVRTGAIVGYKIQGDGAFGGGLKFKTQQAGANPFRDIMRMRSDMIEIPHDNVRLHFGVDGDFRIRHTGSQNQIYGTGTHPIVFSTQGGERLRITSGGSVGIGLTNPEIFHAQARTLVLQEDGHCGLTIDATSGTNSSIFFADGADGSEAYRGYVQYTHSDGTNSDYLTFGTAGDERLRITSDGTVNIGSGTNPSSGGGRLNVKPSSPDSYFKIRNAADFDGTLTGNVIDNRTSDNLTSRDLIVRSMNLVLWQETNEKVRITNTGLVRIGGANANSADIDSTNTKLTIKQTANNQEDGIYIERSGERRGHYIYVGGALGQSDALCFTTNQLGTDTHILALDRSGDIITGTGNVGINEESPTNQLHISGTTNTSAGGLLRLNATTGDNFIILDNTHDSSEWAFGNDSTTRDQFRMWYNGGSGYPSDPIVDIAAADGVVTIDGGTSTLVKIKGDSAGYAALRCGGNSGAGSDQCTGYVEVHQDESHGGGFFYNGDGSPSFASGETADYFSLFRLSAGTRHSVMRWFHSSNECNVQGDMLIDNGTSTIVRVRGDSSGTAGISCGGDSGQTQCTGYLECHQDQIHGGGISYNGDGSPGFVNNESADHITFYRMHNGTRERVFHYPYNSNAVSFRGGISASSKSFRISHPHPSKKDTHDLIHSSIEGPQCDNIYRGKVDLVGGTATVNIDTVSNMTDGTFVLLNRDIQCFTSNETGWTNVKGSVTGNLLTIIAQDNTCTDTISWMVVGERQDDGVKSEDVDTTDTYGKLIVELPR